jgi:hypothetical protein
MILARWTPARATLHPVSGLSAGAFTDPDLPVRYAPFNVQVSNGKVYVSYALPQPGRCRGRCAHQDQGASGGRSGRASRP